MSVNNSMDLYLRPLPFLDGKWLKADLINSLRSIDDTALLWNNLIQDCELVSSPAAPVLNSAGQLAYLGDDGKHYCGAQRLSCTCCPEDYCGPLTACNCASCRTMDSDAAIRKMTSAAQVAANQRIYSDVIFESWLWGKCPSFESKKDCQKILLNELHDIILQAASNCLSAAHLKHHLFIYERFFVALSRTKEKMKAQRLLAETTGMPEKRDQHLYIRGRSTNPFLSNAASATSNNKNISSNFHSFNLNNKRFQNSGVLDVPSPIKEPDRATLGLARVGTRAALNFSFAFLRRAWRSGEDTDLCSELLSEALESLQDLPEASLFYINEVSPLWIEVLERSIKFLRQVTLGDNMMGGRGTGARYLAPREDRHTALSLILELCAQKGTLSATLEAIILLLTLWEKEKETEDNREPHNHWGAPLVPILKRYENISNYSMNAQPFEDIPSSISRSTPDSEASCTNATECFLRFLTLPENYTANIDLKKAAVIIISHLDRLAKPLIPNNVVLPVNISSLKSNTNCNTAANINTNTNGNTNASSNMASKTRHTSSNVSFSTKLTTSEHDLQGGTSDTSMNQEHEDQKIYALGWSELCNEIPGFTSEPAICLNKPTYNLNYNAPVLNFGFQIKEVAFSEETVLFLTTSGKLFTWSITKPESEPVLIESMQKVMIMTIAGHIEGKHFLAVDSKGDGYSWGCGDGGRLGHGDLLPRDEPTQIICIERSFSSVYCGCSYSAAITTSGALYTWGKGNFGRLGHGSSDDKVLPTYVAALRDHHIVDVALGSGDAHTLCVTAEGLLFAWGDGEYGKLGNGSFNGTNLPIQIENVPKIQRVFCGSQFSLALSQDGKLYSWGKPCAGRLGFEHFDNDLPGVSVPKLISALQNKQIVDVSVGLFHCLALTKSGEVFGWGRNDMQQICPSSISRAAYLKTPILATHSVVYAYGIACGPMHSLIWSRTSVQAIPCREPFVIDLTEQTFRLLDQLLGLVCTPDTNSCNRLTPNQESECITVACLNLLRLQLHALISNGISAKTVGLIENSRLLLNLKTRVLSLAGGANILRTIQKSAQKCLEVGWSVLLPTPSERAETLTSLLPAEPGITSAGHRFMTDLLVGSLMADGGLETALNQAINSDDNDMADYSSELPLLHLINQLLRNNSYLTQAQLNTSGMTKTDDELRNLLNKSNIMSPSLSLLHRFQRLLFAHLYQSKGDDVSGAENLLIQYIKSMVTLSIASLQKAHEAVVKGRDGITTILANDISDTLLFEMIIGLILIKRDNKNILSGLDWHKEFVPLMHALDNLNRVLGCTDVQDSDDLSWPGIIARAHHKTVTSVCSDEFNIIRKSEYENELLDGGKLIIIKGVVCDLSDYKSGVPAIDEFFEKNIGKDLSHEFRNPMYRKYLEFVINNFNIGQYGPAVADEKSHLQLNRLLTHFSSERALGYLLGLVAHLDQVGPALQPAELNCKSIWKSQIFCGGLQLLHPNNPFDEEKDDARRTNVSSSDNSPSAMPKNTIYNQVPLGNTTIAPNIEQRIFNFINILAEGKLTEPLVVTWMTLSERYCKENNLMWHQDFPNEHPIQELERLLTAVLIRHQSLGGLVLNALEHELNGTSMTSNDQQLTNHTNYSGCYTKITKEIADIIRIVYQTKWTVVRIRQQLNRSYKEVCAPMLEKLRFLLYEVRPAISLEQYGLKKLKILYKLPRFRQVVKRIISDMRNAKKQLVCGKPEDILNVTIQSQNAAQRLNQSQEKIINCHHQDQINHLNLTHQLQINDNDYSSEKQISIDSGFNNTYTQNDHHIFNQHQNHQNYDSSVNSLNRNELKYSNDEVKMCALSNDLYSEDKKHSHAGIHHHHHFIHNNSNKKDDDDDDNNISTYAKSEINNDFLKRLSEKWYFLGELNKTLMNDIIEFVIQDDVDVETVRRAMFCQIQRYQIRKNGIDLFYNLLKQQGLLNAVQYNIISGYLGLNYKNNKQSVQHILTDLNWLTALQKTNLILSQSKIYEYTVAELQRLVNKEQPTLLMKTKKVSGAFGKDTSNLGTYSFLKKLPRARFLLSIFGILSKDMKGNEISLLINSGLLGVVLALLSQTGGDTPAIRSNNELSVVYEDTLVNQKSHKANLSGPELAKLMKIGTRIVRGADWKWGDQDGNPPGEGRIISEVGEDGWVRVEWFATGATNSYRMGKEGQYDLRLADSALNVISPDADLEKNDFSADLPINGETHPTKLLRYSCAKFLQIIAVGIGMHSDDMDQYSIRTIASMFRSILDTKSTLANICGLDNWTTLGFLRSICGESKILSKHLTSPSWLEFYLTLLDQPTLNEQDVFRKINCLRLLQTVLIHWSDEWTNDINERITLVEKLFGILGRITLYCPNDLSLQEKYQDTNKPRILLTASHSSTVAEEIITLLRKLHTLNNWNDIINSFLSQKLCVAAELFGSSSISSSNSSSYCSRNNDRCDDNDYNAQSNRPSEAHSEDETDSESNDNETSTPDGQFDEYDNDDYDLDDMVSLNIIDNNDNTSVMGVLNTIGGCDLRPRVGLQVLHDGCLATVCGFTPKGKGLLSTEGQNTELRKVPLQTIMDCSDYSVFSLSRLPMNEMLLNAWSILLYGAGERKELVTNDINVNLLRIQQMQLSVLNTNTVLYRHQNHLRNILKQRSPVNVNESFINHSIQTAKNSSHKNNARNLKNENLVDFANNDNENESSESNMKLLNNNELLIQSLLIRATQPSPVKATYSYEDLGIAALNCTQQLSSQVSNFLINNYNHKYQNENELQSNKNSRSIYSHFEENLLNNDHYKNLNMNMNRQATMVHGIPLYNNRLKYNYNNYTNFKKRKNMKLTSKNHLNNHINKKNIKKLNTIIQKQQNPKLNANQCLINQINEMGFSKKIIDIAIQKLILTYKLNPSPEQIIQWIIDHPEYLINESYQLQNLTATATSKLSNSASAGGLEPSLESSLKEVNQQLKQDPDDCSQSNSNSNSSTDSETSSSDTIEGNSIQENIIQKFDVRSNYETSDQYAIYVRGLICPGALVKCYRDFEEIKKGDVGTVLKVDTEGLHNLNVQVDWQIYGNTYWVCFVHLEILELPAQQYLQLQQSQKQAMFEEKPENTKNINNKMLQLNKKQNAAIQIGSKVKLKTNTNLNPKNFKNLIGIVVARNNNEVVVDFPHQQNWKCSIDEIELFTRKHRNHIKKQLVQNNKKLYLNNLLNKEKSSNSSDIDSADFLDHVHLIDDWSYCIRSLTVSSNIDKAKNLLDASTGDCWESSSNGQDKHWIRLEMHENILIYKLIMIVDPNDNSHMPSLVVIKVGDSLEKLTELNWISIKQTDNIVILMSNIQEYYPFIEINVKQCRNNGIQCKIHKIHVIGFKKPQQQQDLDQILANACFLANDLEDCLHYNSHQKYNQHQHDIDQTNITNAPYTDLKSSSSTSSASGSCSSMHDLSVAPCSVMVWGLNDKEQLGGLKGSKVKIPTFSQTISRLRPIHIVGGSKSLFIVSQDGKVYACGEGTNGRLGLGPINNNITFPRLLQSLHQYVVKKVSVHSGGKHALALTLDGKVFSWGEGEDGKLGHGNRLTFDKPKLIEALRSKKIRDIACGSSHSAAITSAGELYTWGLGEYGRLGHGDNVTQLKPKLVTALLNKRVIQVACGSRDAQTLALTEDGIVYSWGDGDFGKLGRGGSEGSSLPHEIERLTGLNIVQIECGAQFSLALTRSGEVWTWGKGDYYRLGHGNDQHVRKPQPVQGLKGRKVIHVAVGALHCLAVTDKGQVYAWGDNDHGQQGSGSTIVNKRPTLVIGLASVFVNRVACGSSHSIAWGMPQVSNEEEKKVPVAFSSNKDPLGGNSLGIYDSEDSDKAAGAKSILGATAAPVSATGIANGFRGSSVSKISLSDIVLSLDTTSAQQTALNYILNAMSILQARQLIVSALTSHFKINSSDRLTNDIDKDCSLANTESQQQKQQLHSNDSHPNRYYNNVSNVSNNMNVRSSASTISQQNSNDVIAQGGGEAPADPIESSSLHELTPEGEAMLPITNVNSGMGIGCGVVSTSITGSIAASTGPLTAFHSLNGSLSLSGSMSSSAAPHKHSKMSASAMSVMAATMTYQEEIIEESSLTGLDDFTSLLGESEAKSLIELLKLSVAGRTGPLVANTSQTIADTLIALGSNSPSIGSMLLETCIVELEDLCTSRYGLGKAPKPIMQESSHPYGDNVNIHGHVKMPGAEALRLEFDTQCSTEKRNDPLVIMDGTNRVIAMRSGREFSQWAAEVRIPGDELRWKFTSDSSVNGWGFRFWVHAVMPSAVLMDKSSDRAILSQPSIALVMALLNDKIMPHNTSVLLRLASALSACAQLNSLSTQQRIWSLKQLHHVLKSKYSPKASSPSLQLILMPLIPEILRQYEYEEPQVRGGIHLMHSEYFKTLVALACDMDLDSVLPTNESHKWSWFKRYCIAIRVAKSLIHRYELPKTFSNEVRKKLYDVLPPAFNTAAPSVSQANGNMAKNVNPSTLQSSNSSVSLSLSSSSSLIANMNAPSNTGEKTSNAHSLDTLPHEDHSIFKNEHDSQLLQWLNRRPDDWSLSWGGASTIYGWGHNHRGQLGGLEGSRIKSPTPCEALSLLRPVQLAGGEQTLFAVTPDGKLFATGYGAGGRLGVGGTDSWTVPTLISSLQHVFVKKVAVNSGGKHCLALTTDGEVYSWGEGEDGKLGHGNRISYDRPKLIEDLTGIGIVDIACGSAHSAAITSSGHVLTWGKGRYGRLGHGDSEDQLRPKLVETLLGFKAIDIACGSGDAQTLCITDDDSVWSWGDGDYGKLGRGGSDGCKIPFKIESLSGVGIIKVECGSQFSVALTRAGAVYTWGKGDFHRLGHGSVDHVRRPKKVAALQHKKVVSIATGSLHCVACTDNGEVYTWGDNDEGQLGDGTVSAIQRPRLVQALQGKHIVKVTCGSAHTLALSTTQFSEKARPPPNPPLEYDLVRDIPAEALHARLVLLHHFSQLLCPCLAMLHINGEISLNALKDVLVYSIKEAAFRKVIQTTMVRDKQHGPVIELNRIQVKRSRSKSGNGLAGIDGMKSVFGQMVQKLPLLTQESLSLPHRVWKVKFVGESVDDCGGGYSESIAEMCDELQNGSVPLLINTPNGRGEAGANRDCFLLDPTLTSVLQMNMFRFLGVLMGIAVRTGSPLSLNLAEPVWRQLAGEELRPSDLTEVDRDYVTGLLCIRNMDSDPKSFNQLELPFSTYSAKGHEVPLSTRYTHVTAQNRHEYVRLALNFRLHEFDEQVKAVRDGMSKVIPVPLLSLFSAAELQAMVCGSPDIPLSLLKSVATYKGFEPTSAIVEWFWEVMEEFSNQERSLFLRFVWGRTRLPRTIADFRGRDFVLQVLEKSPPDHFLPESYTCFFLLKMPRYSCKAVLLEKLKYAIHFCKSIDTDEYARVAMGDPTEATGSEDNSDMESVTSHEV